MTSLMDKQTIASLLDQLSRQGKEYLDNEDAALRPGLLDTVSRLSASLETPADFVTKVGFAEPARNASVRTAIELGIFGVLDAANGHAVTVNDIANKTGADVRLVARIMKHLNAFHIVSETSADSYTPTTLSNTLATVPGLRDGYRYFFDIAGPSFYSVPEYLKKTKYANPGNIADGPFQYAHKTDKPFFLYLNERPESLEHFNNCMTGFRAGKKQWLDFYPWQTRIASNLSEDSLAIVDVGGGLGHDLTYAAQTLQLPASRLLLQDRPEVTSSIPSSSDRVFEKQSHDFFTPQPAKGARVYFLHSVLHDWDDESCVKILQLLREAMKPGHSKVIINEYVVPNTGASWPVTGMDMLMMALGAVKERTEAQWEALLGLAGLKLTAVYAADPGTESIVEAEIA